MDLNRELLAGLDEGGPISDINVTPFIDIMLVLLIIFMVTAPRMLGGVHVNLPKSGGDPMPRPEKPLVVSLDAEARVFVDKEEVAAPGRHERFQELARESETGEVYVRGDGQVPYARMMELMAELGQAGFARVTLVTDVRTGARPAASPDQAAAPSAIDPTTAAPATVIPSATAPAAAPSVVAPAPAAPASAAAPH